MQGPAATQVLGDFGADVIKVERPKGGDIFRWSIDDPAGPDHPAFVSLNRNKRSLAVDLGSEQGREIVAAARPDRRRRRVQLPAGRDGAPGAGLRAAVGHQPAGDLGGRPGLWVEGAVCRQGRPGHARAGVLGRDVAPARRLGAARLPGLAGRLLDRDAPGAGHPAGAARAREDRPRPADRVLAVRLDARDADAGVGAWCSTGARR